MIWHIFFIFANQRNPSHKDNLLKAKNTLSNQLVKRYRLIIRNEDNLAEQVGFSFTYTKFFSIAIIIFAFLFFLSMILSKTLLATWYDPGYAQMVTNKNLHEMKASIDSLSVQLKSRDEFIMNMKYVLNGDILGEHATMSKQGNGLDNAIVDIENIKLTYSDSVFRSEYEQSERDYRKLAHEKPYQEFQQGIFFPPVEGFIVNHYNEAQGNYGLEIVTEANASVKAIADGTIIMATWTQDYGYVLALQHSENLISVYKHNVLFFEKIGTFVKAGSVISMVGEQNQDKVPFLFFELWHNGKALDPEDFIPF